MKRLLPKMLLLLSLLAAAGGGVAASRVFEAGLPFMPKEQAATDQQNGQAKEQHAVGIAFPTRERIVNLADPGVMRYLKTSIVLEVDLPSLKGELPKGEEYKKKQEELAKELKGQTPIIDDQIVAILTARTSAELATPEGKQRLKDELKARLNKALGEERVLAVYFTDFIIQ